MKSQAEEEQSKIPKIQGLKNIEPIIEGTKKNYSLQKGFHMVDDRYYSIKQIKFNEEDLPQEECLKQVKLLAKLSENQHTNLAKLKEAIMDENQVFIISEQNENCSMQQWIKSKIEKNEFPIKEAEIKTFLIAGLKAINHLHKYGIFHMNISVENIIVDSKGILKIGDFGLIKKSFWNFTEKTAGKDANSFAFQAPELLLGIDSYSVDIWAFGVSILRLLLNEEELIDWQLERKLDILKTKGQSEELIYILKKLVVHNQKKREKAIAILKTPQFGLANPKENVKQKHNNECQEDKKLNEEQEKSDETEVSSKATPTKKQKKQTEDALPQKLAEKIETVEETNIENTQEPAYHTQNALKGLSIPKTVLKTQKSLEVENNPYPTTADKIQDSEGPESKQSNEKENIKEMSKSMLIKSPKSSFKDKIKYSNGDVYVGELIGESREGKGILNRKNGDKYDGEFHNDQFHGKGIQEWVIGDRYEGEWVNGKPEGSGSVVYSNKDRQEGQWKNGLFHGQGVAFQGSDEKQEGEWENNKAHGNGKYYYANGDRFEGVWKEDSREGKGILYHSDGTQEEQIYEGGITKT